MVFVGDFLVVFLVVFSWSCFEISTWSSIDALGSCVVLLKDDAPPLNIMSRSKHSLDDAYVISYERQI